LLRCAKPLRTSDLWLEDAVVELLADLFDKTKLASGFLHPTFPAAYTGCCTFGNGFAVRVGWLWRGRQAGEPRRSWPGYSTGSQVTSLQPVASPNAAVDDEHRVIL